MMNVLGYKIEKISKDKEEEFDKACKIIYDMNYRVVKQTTDKSNKKASALEATKIRSDRAKMKVSEAIQYIEENDLKLSIANIVRHGDVSRITAKKYLNEFKESA